MGRLLVALVSVSLLQFGGAEREAVVNALSSAMADSYLDEAAGKRVAGVLRAQLARGEFDALADPEALAAALTDVLQAETHDRHLWVWYRDGAAARLQWAALESPMIGRAAMLPGRIGYIDLRHFVGSAQDIDAAMGAVTDSAALVIDLRLCVGGNLEIVQHLSSYLFAKRVHLLNSLARGASQPIERWTSEQVPGRRLTDVPVYVLTSSRTFSAGEALALGLRANKRAVIVGERTGGGGHFVRGFPLLPNGFQMLLPVGRNVDPRTGSSWEGEGIKPDLAVNPEQALQAAIGHFRGWRAARLTSSR